MSGIVTRDLYAGRKPLPRPRLLRYTVGFAVLAWVALRQSSSFSGLAVTILTMFATLLFYRIAQSRLALFHRGKVIEDGRNALLPFLEGRPLHLDLDAMPSQTRRGAVATGAAYDGHWLYVIEEGTAARIPFSKVRKWRWNIETYKDPKLHVNVSVNGATPTPSLPDLLHREAVDGWVRARLASGLTVQVADVGKPAWRFTTDDRRVLERWHEILTQMREGTLPSG